MPGGAGVPGGAGAPPQELVPQTCDAAIPSQVWEGNTLDFFFNPQNEKWRIEFDGSGPNGRLCGTATYVAAGEAPPPPATDPDAVYPPDYDAMMFGKPLGATPGVTYSIVQGAEVGGVVRFRVVPSELWKDWCALQVPRPRTGGYSCVGGDGWGGDGVTCTVTQTDGTTQEYAYGKCMLCAQPPFSVCSCDAERCAAADDGQGTVFDLKRSGTQLTGTVGGTGITLEQVK